jgi:hypothetical protein
MAEGDQARAAGTVAASRSQDQEAVMQIAEIVVTPTVLQTPAGPIDRARASWNLGGAVPISKSTPQYLVITAVCLIFCTGFLSLLLLLIKEDDMWSSTLVVTDGRVTYTTTVYSRSTSDYEAIRAAIAWAQRPIQPRPHQTGRLALPGA